MTKRSPADKNLHADEIRNERPNQVFYSPGARRGWALLTVLVLVTCFVAVSVAWATVATTQLPVNAARYNTSVNYPREVADAVVKCAKTNGQYGDNGSLEVPVIGNGVFQRVVKIVHDGGTDYAVDPYTGQVYRPLTQLEAHASRCGYAVEEFGTVPAHTLILTYDDGPEQPWTAELLGILDAYHVHATFFNIGDEVIAYEEAFRSVLAHGNAVGSHSLTHPELVTLSNTAARDQLLETARIMAQVGNYSTRIWRTPYQGGDPVSAGNGMFDTLMGQQLGFTEVGFTSDTSDYALVGQEIPPPPLSRDPNSPGQVVIMHDGGGNRKSTMALSAKIIREGQSDGYTFMTIPQLLAEQPGWHGPVISRGIRPTPVDAAGYWQNAYASVFRSFYAGLIRYMTVIIIVISALVLICAGIDRWLTYRRAPNWHPDALGVLIPCWKESKVIRYTVQRILDCAAGLPYPVHIVLVDDGSADNDPDDKTWEIMGELVAAHPGVITAVHKSNGGKARALNFGLQYITADIVVVMDADTIPRDTASFVSLVRWFKDPRVGAVAGYTKAGDRGKGWRQYTIAEFQSAEYDLGIALTRSVQNLSNSIVIVPGAFSAFRTKWLREVGYLPDRVVAEDAEAPQRMRRRRPRMRIVQDLNAVAFTEVPLSFKVLRTQWRRWTLGVLQTLWEHREIFYRMDKYQILTLQWWFALYGTVIPPLFLCLSYIMLIYGLTQGTLGPIYLFPIIFIGFRIVQVVIAMIILRSKMNPFAAIWYRFINDPLQMYLTCICFWLILSGRMPTNRKIWSQVPRSGVLISSTVVGTVGSVPVPTAVSETGGMPLAEVSQVSQEEWERETAQVPEEAEWQRETAETSAIPVPSLDGDPAHAREATGKAESNGAGEAAEPHTATSNGTVSGTASNGASEAAEPVWSDATAVPDWEPDTGPIPRVSWEPEETGWDTEALLLPDRGSGDAEGHPEANGHREADGETDADQQSPTAMRQEGILPAERG